MNCPVCRASNPEGAKFCMECGNSLRMKCGHCGSDLGANARFCTECGTKAGQAEGETPASPSGSTKLQQYIPKELQAKLDAVRNGQAMVGERRVVTMLFCDVKGSTSAAEKLDPEEWAEIMNGAFEFLIAPVYRYEGTLARLMGDAVLAFFGAPIAHEDDAHRAVLAGLAMVQEISVYRERVSRKWGLDFDVRVGINTGLVVVGEVGSDMRLEYTAMGDAVNVAARMEQTAAPGTVQISEQTQKLVAPLFDLESLEAIQVKGKEHPINAFRAIAPKIHPGRLRGIEGLDSPMVGRDQQLAALRGLVDGLVRGAGQLVSVMGEAGLGKSRLIAELKKSLPITEGGETDLLWCEGRSLSYQTTTPYAPVIDLLSELLGVGPDSPQEGSYETLRASITRSAGDEAERIAPYIASILSVPVEGDDLERVRFLDPPELRRRVDESLVDFFEILSRSRPVVLSFEDLHWADASSLALIEKLMPVTDREKLMLIGVFRPQRQEPSWRYHEVASRDWVHRYCAVSLVPLDDGDARQLVANLLHVEGLPASTRELILSKSEGNPLFVEEVIRSLLDAGVVVKEGESFRATKEIGDIAIPDNLTALLTARLDRLDETTRHVLQTASVLGREFDFDVLASIIEPLSVANDTLADLQRRGLLRETARVPRRRYAFKHVLIQEAAYQSLLLKSRRELHHRVADVFVRTAPEQTEEIARHYVEAREEALALPWLIESAERAARAYSAPEAISRFRQAIGILESGASGISLATRAYEGLGRIYSLLADFPTAIEVYESMRRYAALNKDVPLEVSALNKLGMIHAVPLGDDTKGTALLDEAEQAAEDVGCKSGLAEGCMVRCYIHTFKAEFDEAYTYLDRAAKLGQETEAEDPLLYGMTHIANTLVFMTEYDRAWPQIQDAMAKAKEFGNKKYLSELMTFAKPLYLLRTGDIPGAIASAREGAVMADEIGNAFAMCNGASLLGTLATLQGRFEEGIFENQRAVTAGKASGLPFLEGMALCTLGTSYLQISERLHEKALEIHMKAIETMERPNGRALGALNWCEVGFCAMEVGKLDEARELFDQGLQMESAAKFLFKPQLHVGAGCVALLQGRINDARQHAEDGRAFAEEKNMVHTFPFIALLDAHIANAEGRHEEALERFTVLEEIASEFGLRPLHWKSCAESARLLDSMGRDEDAAARRRKGHYVVGTIASEFHDEGLRAMYVRSANAKLAGVS